MKGFDHCPAKRKRHVTYTEPVQVRARVCLKIRPGLLCDIIEKIGILQVSIVEIK